MSSPKNINQKFNELKFILKNKDKHSIKMDAHGGYSILFIYPPEEEKSYLKKIEKKYPDADFIDIARMFVEFIDSIGYDDFIETYEEYSSEPEKLFKSSLSESDFFTYILNEIEKAGEGGKMPILVRTGALYGTGIENINIMDSKIVHELPMPLIIMYPATVGGDNKLKYLNFKPASDYRAVVIF